MGHFKERIHPSSTIYEAQLWVELKVGIVSVVDSGGTLLGLLWQSLD
jgi:hypothetical protein